MSDQKKLNKRLSDLFADLEGEITQPPDEEKELSGWTWEIDSQGLYSHCSPEVEEILGVKPEDFLGERLTTFKLAAGSQGRLTASLESKQPKSELTLQFLTADEFFISARMYIIYIPADDGVEEHWRGFAQIIQDETTPESASPPPLSLSSISSLSMPEGIAIEDDQFYSVSTPYSAIGQQSLELRQTILHEATSDIPASMAVPVELQQQALGLLEFIDENPNRHWSKEEQRLVEEVAGQLSLALENARLIQEITEQSKELALINRVVSQVASSLDLSQSLHSVVVELGNALDIQVNIALLNPDGVSLTMAADYSPRQENPFVVGYEIPITGNPSTERVFETKQPVIIEDPQTNPLISSVHDLMRSLNVQSMGIFPMIVQDDIFGTVGLYILDEGRTLTRGEIQLVETILVQAASAVQNARLFEQIQTRSTQLQTAAEISRAASSILEPNPLIMQAVNLIRDRFDLYYAGIFLVDEDGSWTGEAGHWAVLRAGTGEAGSIQVEQGHKLEMGGDSMIGQCISTSQARISQLAPDEIQRFANPLLPDTQSEMALPLISRGKVIGAMTIQSVDPAAFSEEDISVLQTMADQVATALQNANLFNQTQQNATELSILNEMSLALSRQLDINGIIQTIHQFTSQLMDTTYFFVALHNADEDMVSFPLVVENNEIGQIPAMKKSRGLTQHVIDSREPLLIYENVELVIKDLGLEEIFVGEPAQSWLGVPLLIGDEVLGVISTQNATRPGMFNEHHQELLLSVARQSAIAIQNARLFEQTRQRNEELALINRIVTKVAGSLDLTESLQIIATELGEAMDAQTGIALLNPEYTTSTIAAAYSPNPDRPPAIGIEFPVKGNLSSQHVIKTKKPLVIEDAQNDPLTAPIHNMLRDHGIISLAIFPLITSGRVIGTVGLDILEEERTFTNDEIRLVETIVIQAATAIENARLFGQTQRQLANISTIQETTAGLSAALTLDGVVNTLLAHLTSAVQADSASVFSIDGTRLIRVGVYPSGGESSPEIGQAVSLKDNPLTQHVIDTQEPLAVSGDDVKLQQHALEAFKAAGIAANATIPIAGPEGVLGTISVSRNHPAPNFTESELALMGTLANQAAVAILNARSYERVQEVAEEMSMLFDVSQAISNAPIGVKEIANVVAHNFVEILAIPECSVSLISQDGSTLKVVADLFIDDSEKKIVREELVLQEFSIDDFPATEKVLKSLQPLVVQSSDPNADPNELAYMSEGKVATLAIIPLAVKGQAIGVLEFEHLDEEYHYSQQELNLAMTLANQAAVALDNALLYEEQREITEQLRELDKLKSQFLANMSHELRTPLNSIIGFSRVIMKGIDGPVTDQQTQDLSAIYNAGQHLLNMINDILDISKIEAGKMELAFEDIDLPQIIESVLSTARGLVKDRPVELHTDIPDDLPIVHADPTRIRQILLNLLSNATKFTDEGSITVKVRQQTGPSGRSEVCIGIIDTGVGIAPEDQQDLFEPFTQVDGSATRKTGGTGLGLSITRLLVDLHDGEINIDSKPGEGSTFYFSIPIAPKERFTILAIDGDPQVTELYQHYLNDTKYKIISVLNPSDALEMACELQPFAITLDINLPKHDGWEIFQIIQDDPDTKHIPILICSLKDDPEKAQSMGAADYLSKPILRDDLINALGHLPSDEDADME